MWRTYVFSLFVAAIVIGGGVYVVIQARQPVPPSETTYDVETPADVAKRNAEIVALIAPKPTLQPDLSGERKAIDKWTQAIVHVTCTFDNSDISKSGWALAFNSEALTPLMFVGTRIISLDIPTGIQLYNSCAMQFANGIVRSAPRNKSTMVVTENNSVYKEEGEVFVKERYTANTIDGIAVSALPFPLPDFITLDAKKDACSTLPSLGDEVVLLGLDGQGVKALPARISHMNAEQPILSLSPTEASDDMRFFVIDEDRNCYVGFATRNREKVLTF